MSNLQQLPAPDSRHVRYRGDRLTMRLELDAPREGTAFVRTNVGRAHIRRREIALQVETGQAFQCRDWHDLPMQGRADGRSFEADLLLDETGRCEAKAFFIPAGSTEPEWPPGGNTIIKIEPVDTVCANTLYTVFVRQFGPGKSGPSTVGDNPQPAIETLERAGFTVIPRSGTFRDVIGQLDFIVNTLGFRIIQLLPIHPVPTTYARMGRFGSPFASLDFMDVDPAYAEFDRRTTPMDQFRELADAVHARHARLFIDLPINHTGWASFLQNQHPEWFRRNPDAAFQSPGAWGVTWEDLSALDYSSRLLWEYMAEVFLFWCEKGVDGFRCDAGYMVPQPVWTYIVACVRDQFPETIFLLEGLGGKISVMENLLAEANLNWAYSEIFQCHDRAQLAGYISQAHAFSRTHGTLIHFAETHDNNRLAAVSPDHARMRTALAALLSDAGAFGITNGVEWFATDKVDVHGAPALNWDAPLNQIEHIHRLNTLLATHPCFEAGTTIEPIEQRDGNILAVRRRRDDRELLVLINLDVEHPHTAHWHAAPAANAAVDLMDDADPELMHDGATTQCRLEPAQVRCLTADPAERNDLELALATPLVEPPAVARQRRQALIADLTAHFYPDPTTRAGLPPAPTGSTLTSDPAAFCAAIAGLPPALCVTVWDGARDSLGGNSVRGTPGQSRHDATDGAELCGRRSTRRLCSAAGPGPDAHPHDARTDLLPGWRRPARVRRNPRPAGRRARAADRDVQRQRHSYPESLRPPHQRAERHEPGASPLGPTAQSV